MRGLTLATALALRARTAPRSVVLIDLQGQLTAAELLALARKREDGAGTARLAAGPLREILATAAAPGLESVELRSSGTTGAPRAQRRGPITPAQLITGLDLARRIGMRPGRTIACAAPGEHGHGLSTAAGALVLGMRLVDISRTPPPEAHALITRARPDIVSGVPVHLQDLARTGPLDVPRAISGSDVLTAEARRLLHRAGVARIHDVYGTTETGALSVDGTALWGVRIRVAGGLLHVKTPFTGGRTVITDRGSLDARGHVVVHGRADGQIVSGGMLHDPAVVQQVIAEIPGIAEVRLEVVPDDRFGRRTRAHVLRAPGAHAVTGLADHVRDHVRQRLGPAAVPREVLLDEDGPDEDCGLSTPGARPGPP